MGHFVIERALMPLIDGFLDGSAHSVRELRLL
jgi:hypothetical protein